MAVENCIPIGSHSTTCELQPNQSILNKIEAKTHPTDSHRLCSTTLTVMLFGACFSVSAPVQMLQSVAICYSRPPEHHACCKQLQSVAICCKTEKIGVFRSIAISHKFFYRTLSENPAAKPFLLKAYLVRFGIQP